MDDVIGRREAPRHAVSVMGKLRTGRGTPFDVEVADLSERGCRINEKSIGLAAGTNVTISIDSLQSIDATIRWIGGGQVGLEFHRPIYGLVFEHLRDLLASSATLADRRSADRSNAAMAGAPLDGSYGFRNRPSRQRPGKGW